MSTATMTIAALDVSATRPVPFSRLVQVEMRKMADTRAGVWLLIAIGAVTAPFVTIYFFAAGEENKTFFDFLGTTTTPQGLLLPVLGILLITSEWGQRTTLTTFALTPRRPGVIWAKAVAACLLGLVAVALAMVLAAVATALGGTDNAWANLGLDDVLMFGLVQILTVIGGLAFGLIFLNSPPAIVLYLFLPQVFNTVFSAVSSLRDTAPWVTMSQALQPLQSGDSLTGEEWAQLATSSLIWMVVPFLAGLWRVMRAEVK